MSFLEQLGWRYATKKFDSNKKVSEADKTTILEAIRLAPTSHGLQPFHVTVVNDPLIREKLKQSAYNQSQITDADFILVFSSRTDVVDRVHKYFDMVGAGDEALRQKLTDYENTVVSSVSSRDELATKAWTAKQAYIALGFGLAACAELQIDSCPMEGFDPDAFKKILELPENYFPQAVLAVGYRSDDDTLKPKVRFPSSDLFTEK